MSRVPYTGFTSRHAQRAVSRGKQLHMDFGESLWKMLVEKKMDMRKIFKMFDELSKFRSFIKLIELKNFINHFFSRQRAKLFGAAECFYAKTSLTKYPMGLCHK